jgi:uncharacterized protein (DUF488 family)
VARLFPSHLNPNPEAGDVIYTLGTSTRSFDEFLTLFKEYKIEAGVDIRSFPTSRFPHFKKESLQRNLESEGIQYLYLGKELGGFRKGGYLAYMETDSFQKGLERLEEVGREKRTAFFCSERFPWKCHRRWVAGELAKRGWKIVHIIERGKVWIPNKRDQVLMGIGH